MSTSTIGVSYTELAERHRPINPLHLDTEIRRLHLELKLSARDIAGVLRLNLDVVINALKLQSIGELKC